MYKWSTDMAVHFIFHHKNDIQKLSMALDIAIKAKKNEKEDVIIEKEEANLSLFVDYMTFYVSNN